MYSFNVFFVQDFIGKCTGIVRKCVQDFMKNVQFLTKNKQGLRKDRVQFVQIAPFPPAPLLRILLVTAASKKVSSDTLSNSDFARYAPYCSD